MLDVRFSRPLGAAGQLGELAPDRHRFVDKRVLLTGEADALNTANGATLLDASLRLLVRLCPNLTVALPDGCAALRLSAMDVAAEVAFRKPVEFPTAGVSPSEFDAVLSIGTTARPGLPWTVVNSNGWLARVSSGKTDLPGDCEQANPIGALFAASLGAAEVFKRLIRLKPERGRLLDGVVFNTYTYEAGSDDPGPILPDTVQLDVTLVGAGAIGNGVLYLVQRMPVAGRMWIVDRETFQDENLGTCILIGPADVGAAKSTFAERLLDGSLLAVKGFSEELSTFKKRLGTELKYPQIVLGAVDSIDARYEIQDLWPALVIDGAIGTFPCQVSRHRWGRDEACLRCLFRAPTGEPSEKAASRVTGLQPERARNLLDVVTEADVLAAPRDMQDSLRRHIGRQICSVVAEAMAQRISLESQRSGFEPSIPFVACLSACMMVSELTKATLGWESRLETRFQWDSLFGPYRGEHFPQARRRDCLCVERGANIERLRDQRANSIL